MPFQAPHQRAKVSQEVSQPRVVIDQGLRPMQQPSNWNQAPSPHYFCLPVGKKATYRAAKRQYAAKGKGLGARERQAKRRQWRRAASAADLSVVWQQRLMTGPRAIG